MRGKCHLIGLADGMLGMDMHQTDADVELVMPPVKGAKVKAIIRLIYNNNDMFDWYCGGWMA